VFRSFLFLVVVNGWVELDLGSSFALRPFTGDIRVFVAPVTSQAGLSILTIIVFVIVNAMVILGVSLFMV
jgi:hypothetical protein